MGLIKYIALLLCVFAVVIANPPECPEVDPPYGAYFPDLTDYFVLLACVFAVVIAKPSLTEAKPKCPEVDPPYGAYFPDPTDCRYFYLCSNGEAIHIMCPSGTVYNRLIRTCDHIYNPSCIPSK
ncbi:hypothetical protein RN001_010709 [Aquatica leii]|uniref:Chitin-binding type-2 domain-containing protein n=1 Tax=Aquatica leii TaxID=1421715 RepID=A0AAN7SNE7_9COLE|nr:hypothetical protein RN001_010709 [Aquatica leii]